MSGHTISMAAAGAFHSVALAKRGEIYSWGLRPLCCRIRLSYLTHIISLLSAAHSVALAKRGEFYAWGYPPPWIRT